MTAIAGSRRRVSSRPETSHSRELDWLMLVTVALCCLGLVMAVSVRGSQLDVGPLIAMKSQGSKLLAGLAAFLFVALLPMSFVRRACLPAFLLATLACLIVPWISDESKGAHRWIKFGSFQFQPVEPARFFFVLAASWLLARAGDGVAGFRRGFVPAMGCSLLLVGALLLQPDNGNALIVLALATSLALIAGVRFVYFVPFAGVSIVRRFPLALKVCV